MDTVGKDEIKAPGVGAFILPIFNQNILTIDTIYDTMYVRGVINV